MPLCEIEERFTRSELALVGWRSQETAYQLDLKMKQGSAGAGPPSEASKYWNDPSLPTNMPERFFNEEGELDLRQVTGDDALKFLHMQGVNVPLIPSKGPREALPKGPPSVPKSGPVPSVRGVPLIDIEEVE